MTRTIWIVTHPDHDKDHPGVLAQVRAALEAAGFVLRDLGTGPDGESVVVVTAPAIRFTPGEKCRVVWMGAEYDAYYRCSIGPDADVTMVCGGGTLVPVVVPVGNVRKMR